MKNRILYFSPYFWPEEIGSAPYCTELARFLADQGHQVKTLAFRPHYPNADLFPDWQEGQNDHTPLEQIQVQRVAARSRGKGGLKTRLFNDLRYAVSAMRSGLSRSNRKTDVVVAYVPSILTLYAAFVTRLRTGARVIAIVHDIESGMAGSLGLARGRLLLWLMRRIERIGLNAADQIVVLTDSMQEALRQSGCRRPITILPIWAKVAAQQDIDHLRRPVIMYSGNFGKKQNLDQLLPLIQRLDREDPEVEIILRGDGSEKPRLQQAIQAMGVSNVRFLPLAPAASFVDALQSVNVHLVPQAQNVADYALPSKLISIMSAGRPFVCMAEPDSTLTRLSQSSQAGLCVSVGDHEALYNAVVWLLSDIERQQVMGDNGRRFVGLHMDRSRILAEYGKLIQSLGPQAAVARA